ncbi:CIPK3 [Symbiodinium natans]|uniref:CIPK3 protein n=1 Tax=Symbiodinium natans TaxID=878477 RepID=A0A812V6S6_9DINO|nr:CIPK3 [Symbiodinium natans]
MEQFAEHGAWVSKTVQVVAETRDEPRGAGRYKAVVADLESCVGKWQRAPPQSLGNGKQRWVTEKRRQMRATTFRLPFASVTFLLARSGECELQKAPCAIIVCDGVPKHRKAWLRFSKFSVDDSDKDIRIMDEKEKIFDLYLWNEVLQEEGDGGKVVVCEPKPAHSDVPFRTYVMKMRSKKSLREATMEEQFRKSLFSLLNLPEHTGVLPLQEVLEDSQFYYIVMEQATGGSFFGGLLSEFEDGVMPPQEVRRLMRGILEAIGHVHERGIIHRDLKPDNLVMRLCDDVASPTGKSRQVAIIDFDHADPDYQASVKTPRACEYFCGTVYFSAPEAFLGYFSPASDLYSIGIILYLLMAGKMPFDSSLYQEEMSVLQQSPKSRAWTMNIYKRLKSKPIDWRCDPWPKQPLCCSFCQWLLAFEPGQRPGTTSKGSHKVEFAEFAELGRVCAWLVTSCRARW